MKYKLIFVKYFKYINFNINKFKALLIEVVRGRPNPKQKPVRSLNRHIKLNLVEK